MCALFDAKTLELAPFLDPIDAAEAESWVEYPDYLLDFDEEGD